MWRKLWDDTKVKWKMWNNKNKRKQWRRNNHQWLRMQNPTLFAWWNEISENVISQWHFYIASVVLPSDDSNFCSHNIVRYANWILIELNYLILLLKSGKTFLTLMCMAFQLTKGVTFLYILYKQYSTKC